MSATETLMRMALRLTPRRFREAYGDELMATHRQRRAAIPERRRLERMRFGVSELAGVLAAVVQLRLFARDPRAARAGQPRRSAWFEALAQDVRFAGRTLRRSPSFAIAATLVLALGIGASTAIFSAVNTYFFRPLPFAEPERLVMLYETNPEFEWVDAPAAPANVLDWRERVTSFADVAAYSDMESRLPLVRDGEPRVVQATAVTGNFFSVLGVRPVLGRAFTWNETWEGQDDGVVLSHALWTSEFGSDPSVVGRLLELGSRHVRVIGVMPPGFSFPSAETRLWYSWGWAPASRDEVWFRRAHFVQPIARLARGVTRAQADAELQSVVRRLQSEYPATNSVMGAGMMPARDFLIRDVRRPLLILLGSVGVLLLLACVNVANLTLVRGAARTREMALRNALGAGRARVAVQLLTESVITAFIGGAIGIALGWAGVRAMGALTPLGIDGATTVELDTRVVLFTLAATLLSGVLSGIVPAARATQERIHGGLTEGGRGGTLSRGGLRTVSGFVVAEVGLALLLVIGAGLMIRSFLLMRDVEPGFRIDDVLAVEVSVPSSRYEERAAVLAFQDQLIEALEARPGIERAGFVAQLPLNGTSWSSQLHAEGWPADRVGFEILHRRTDAGYFEALGIPLLRGRMLDTRDGQDAPYVVVVNETFVREHFPDEDPIGRRIAYDREPGPESTWYEIVGIVGDQHQESPARPVRAEVFESRYQDWARGNWIVMRTTTDPLSILPTVRTVLHELDPLIPISRARTMRDVWRASMAREEFILTLLTVFGALALLLAMVGVYGVTEQAARRRTREIGIRVALGARAQDVLQLMLRQTLVVIGIGLAVGLAVALFATRALRSLLYGIAPNDPATLIAVLAGFAVIACVACWVPARRAMGRDPVASLRE